MARTNYIWDEVNDTLLAETDGNGNTIAEYTQEPGRFGPLISQRRNGHTYYHHYDGQGSTRVLTDEFGTVTDTYTYDAWGNAVARSGATANPFRWVGQVGCYWDESAGAFYIQARVYDPAVTRWMSQDSPSNPMADGSKMPASNDTAIIVGLTKYTCICACHRVQGFGEGVETWDERYEVAAIDRNEAEKLCSKKCKDISSSFWWLGGKRCSGIIDTGFFYICDRAAQICTDCTRKYGVEELKDKLCRHWDVFHSIEGMIRRGQGGVPNPGEGTRGLPEGIDWHCVRLIYRGRVAPIDYGGALKWGKAAKTKCKVATQADIKDCIQSRPKDTSFGANCQTDIAKAALDCCLLGVPMYRLGNERNCRCCD
jgi:RHS repeat-associated protein